MCGVVGALSFDGNPYEITDEYIVRMRDTMLHRGPDGAGLWISKNRQVGLGHRRLAIIDLSDNAIQPMSNESQTVWITFNGEIYNHAEVRKELEATGRYKWKTHHSDTEVVVHAFEEWGIDCVHRFRGMFAIGIWDERKRELWLIRDRIGVKPLYYSEHHGRVVFASEIKALLQDRDQKRAVNEDAFFHYLSFLTTPAPTTLFEGIQKLSPGTWICYKANGQKVEKRYWDVWENTIQNDFDEVEHSRNILNVLREAVQLRKVSDVPVGVFLSGGIDSSTNAVLFSEGGQSEIKTFSIGYDKDYGTYKNELHYARMVADFVGAEHHEQKLTVDDLIDFLPNMIRLQDEPIADPVCVPVYYVSKLARDNGVIVCQVGEGADELFWGYPSWRTKHDLAKWNDLPVPKVFKQIGLKGLDFIGRGESLEYEFLRRGMEGFPIFWGGADTFTDRQKKLLISDRLKKDFANRTSWEALLPIWERFEKSANEKSHLNWMTYLDLSFRLPELLLMRVDKMSMAVSLEGRVPFLDHKFVEYSMSIPSEMKIKNRQLKYLLKKSVRGTIPDEIIDRPKQGFGVPVYEWLFDKLGDQVRTELRSFCKETDYFDPKQIDRMLNGPPTAHMWYLLNFSMWWKEYVRG